ncbi:hypothetical protein BGY98DRAFT_716006 [Russula aff. rugulosa BPL654]|nr:hypothetical protein BGY98DRAFT_716006 [Russula aff. rugulosa BPL654]
MSKSDHAIILSAALLDTLLFGLIVQQYYSYWTGGYNDRFYLKFFVNVQFALVALQSILIWHLSVQIFVVFDGDANGPPPPAGALWSGPVNSLIQVFIIIFANIFLVTRIHGLTKSLVQSLTPMFFSIIAFVFGMVTIVASTWTQHSQTYRYATSVVWYGSQTVAECLISFFLVRTLLKARSGMQKTDMMVKYLVRNVIQTAGLATIWAIAALVARFWLTRVLIYRVFDITSGTVYTHAILDTLISRSQMRDRMASTSAYVDLGLPSGQSRASGRFGHVVVSNLSGAPQSNSDSEPTFGDKNDAIELGKVPEGKPSGLYEF